jgi:hypothetical protein
VADANHTLLGHCHNRIPLGERAVRPNTAAERALRFSWVSTDEAVLVHLIGAG